MLNIIKSLNFFDSPHFWRLGQKSKNNFVLFFFGSNETKKVCFWNYLTFNPIPTSYRLNQPIRGRNRVKKEQETDAFFAHSIVFDQNKSQSLTSRCAIREKFAHLYEWVVTKVIIQKSLRESSLWNRI